MKLKYLTLLFFLTISVGAKSQTFRIFYDKNHRSIKDSTKADYFISIERLSDSAWLVNEYKTPDLILSSGTYKDQKMKIPHGKFIYYRITWQEYQNKIFFTSSKESVGFYIDGKKSGQWINYFNDGSKSGLNTYENGTLNGLYQTYFSSGKVMVQGNYVNDLKEGEWDVLGEDSMVKIKEVYEHGKKIRTIQMTDSLPAHTRVKNISSLQKITYDTSGTITKREKIDGGNEEKIDNAYPDFDFNNYLAKKIHTDITSDMHGLIICQFWVGKDGAISDLQVSRKLDDNIDQSVITAIMNSPLWKPAKKGKRNVEQVVFCSISIHDFKVVTKYGSTLFDLY